MMMIKMIWFCATSVRHSQADSLSFCGRDTAKQIHCDPVRLVSVPLTLSHSPVAVIAPTAVARYVATIAPRPMVLPVAMYSPDSA